MLTCMSQCSRACASAQGCAVRALHGRVYTFLIVAGARAMMTLAVLAQLSAADGGPACGLRRGSAAGSGAAAPTPGVAIGSGNGNRADSSGKCMGVGIGMGVGIDIEREERGL